MKFCLPSQLLVVAPAFLTSHALSPWFLSVYRSPGVQDALTTVSYTLSWPFPVGAEGVGPGSSPVADQR